MIIELFVWIPDYIVQICDVIIYKKGTCTLQMPLWSHQGLNLGPPDYESGATNQLSYRTNILFAFGNFFVGLRILCQSLPKGSSFLRRSSALKFLKTKPKSYNWLDQNKHFQ